MTKEQIQQAKDGAKLMLEMAESAEECDYLRKNAVSVQQVHNRQLTSLEDRLRDAQNVIKTQERELEELSRHRETGATLTKLIDGQPIEYWVSVAKSAAQRNDELLTALREKERIAAEWELRWQEAKSQVIEARVRRNTLQRHLDATQEKMSELRKDYQAYVQDNCERIEELKEEIRKLLENRKA